MSKMTAEEKRIKRRASEKKRMDTRLEKLAKNGITDSITYKGKNYTPKQLARQNVDIFEKAIRSHKQKTRRDEARRYAKALGATDEEAKKIRSFRQVKGGGIPVQKEDSAVYHSPEHLSIVWANNVDKFDFRPFIEQAKRMTVEQLRNEIEKMYREAKYSNDSGSDHMNGFYIMDYSKNPKDLTRKFADDKKRGYTYSLMAQGGTFRKRLVNTTDADLQHMMLSQDFTERGILTMMFVMMQNMKNSDVKTFYQDMELFTEDNLPELHKKIF